MEALAEQHTALTKAVSHSLQSQLRQRWRQGRYVCVGLDTDDVRIPETCKRRSTGESIFEFNRAIVDATQQSVCAYKPNAAFYERHGPEGIEALIRTVSYIKQQLPQVPVILDAKRGDIGNTNLGYAVAAFDVIGVDAITIHPYLGREAAQPFLDRRDKGLFVLAKTSNPGAGEFQDLPVGPDRRPLYEHVADQVARHWNVNGNCGVVVGAPYPAALHAVRSIIGSLPILVPGIGTQGGEIGPTIRAGRDSEGHGLVINSARDIIYASSGRDYAVAAGRAATQLNETIARHSEA
jgi:orotidine-5'-phosphate decarboxylase